MTTASMPLACAVECRSSISAPDSGLSCSATAHFVESVRMTPVQEGQPFDPHQASREAVKAWLKTALDGYFEDDAGRWAFMPLELRIGGQADLAHDLKEIYDSLAAAAKTRWRGAVSELLAEQGHVPRYRETTTVLIDLSVLMPAFEALEVLPGVVANAGEGDEGWLYDRVVSAAIALSRQTEQARDCLDRLRTSPGFSPTHAGLIFIALCRADPDGWPDHAGTMRRALQRLMVMLEPDSDAPRWYAERFLEAVTLSRLASGLRRFLEYGSPAEDWLWRELFTGEKSLFGLDKSDDIYLREEWHVRISLGDRGWVETVQPSADRRASPPSGSWAGKFKHQSRKIRDIARRIEGRGWTGSDSYEQAA